MTDQSREEVAQYDFQGAKVRAVVIDGEPALVGKDVCEALGIKNNRDALNRLDKDGVGIADNLVNKSAGLVTASRRTDSLDKERNHE